MTRRFAIFAIGFHLIAGIGVQPALADVGLTSATLTSPANGTALTYGQHLTYCYVIPTSAPENSNDPYSGKPSTARTLYVDGKAVSTAIPDTSPRGVEQCPIDTYVTAPGTHTWWIVLGILEWRVTGTSAECQASPPVPSECYAWVDTGETATSTRSTYTVGAAPTGPVGVSMNSGATYTTSREVALHVSWPAGATGIIVSNDGGFASARTFGLVENLSWTLVSSGDERLPKTVYVRFRDKGDTTYTDDIILDETPPAVTAPTVSATASRDVMFAAAADWVSLLAAANRQVTVSWSGSDSNSGLDRFELQSSNDGGSWASMPLTNASATSASTTLADGTYRFRVRAKDKAGNWSSWATSAQLQLTDPTATPVASPQPSVAVTETPGASPSESDNAATPTAFASPVAPSEPVGGAASAQLSAAEIVALAFGSGLAGAALLLGGYVLYRRFAGRR